MAEKLSAAQQRAVDWISGHNAAELGSLGTEVGKMLAELTVELADAKREAAHWRQAFETVRDEIKVVVAVCIRKLGGARLTVTKNEYMAVVKDNTELYCGSAEEGARMYELRRRAKKNPVEDAVKGALNGQIITPH